MKTHLRRFTIRQGEYKTQLVFDDNISCIYFLLVFLVFHLEIPLNPINRFDLAAILNLNVIFPFI